MNLRFLAILALLGLLALPAHANPDVAAGQEKLRSGDAKAAFDLGSQAVQAEPGSARAHLLLADAAAALGRHDVAGAEYARAMELDEKSPEAFLHAGDYLSSLFEFEGARECYMAAVAIAPTSAAGPTGVGSTYLGEYLLNRNGNKLVLAISHLEKAAALPDATVDTFYRFADASLLRMGKTRDARTTAQVEQALQRGLERYPDAPLLLYARGRLRYAQRSFGAAREDLQRSIDRGLDPPDAEAAAYVMQMIDTVKEMEALLK